MSLAIGSTMRQSGFSTTNVTAVNQLLNLGTTADFGVIGLTSDNDGTFRNVTGQEVVLNGMLQANLTNTTGSSCIISIATSPDKITWTEQEIAVRGVRTSRMAFISDFKVSVPNQYYIGAVVRALNETTTTLTANTGCLLVRSDKDLETPPLLDVKCSFPVGSFVQRGVTGIGGWVSIQFNTTEFPGSLGGFTDMARIYNDTGQTITVDGSMAYVVSTGSNIFGNDSFNTTTGRNGSPRNNSGSNDITNNTGGLSTRRSIVIFYTQTLQPGDYINPMLWRNSGTQNQFRIYTFQHSMRSRT